MTIKYKIDHGFIMIDENLISVSLFGWQPDFGVSPGQSSPAEVVAVLQQRGITTVVWSL